MFRPRLRKVPLKRAFDATLARGVATGARLVIVSSPREREDVVACGVDPARVRLRGNAFPEPPPRRTDRPARAGSCPRGAPVVLYVGRIAAEKGIEHLVEAARRLPDVHVVLAGPDDRHGTMASVERGRADPAPRGASTCSLRRRAAVRPLSARRRLRARLGRRELRARRGRGGGGRDARGRLRPHRRRRFVRRGRGARRPVRRSAATVDAVAPRARRRRAAASLADGALRAAARSTWDAVVDEQVAIYSGGARA